jgi:hypothetical protein
MTNHVGRSSDERREQIVYESTITDPDTPPRPTTRLWRLVATWLLLSLCVLLWWAARYSNWFERAGEWQFTRIGRYYPAMTLWILLLCLVMPLSLLVWASNRARAHDTRAEVADPEGTLLQVQAASRRWRRMFQALTIVTATITMAALVSVLWLPDESNATIRIVRAGTVPPMQGLGQIKGRWRVGQVAWLEENFLFARRTLFVAPVRFEGAARRDSWLLTVMDPIGTDRFEPTVRGVLVRKGLPKELRNLYRSAGIAIDPDAFLLMRDAAQVRWRSLVLALQASILTTVAATGWLLLRRQERRLGDLRPTGPTVATTTG